MSKYRNESSVYLLKDSKCTEDESDVLEQIRDLLFGEELNRIEEIQRENETTEIRIKKVAEVIAEAIVDRNRKDDLIGKALEPNIENAIQVSIKKDPIRLAEALFPIMGPAIRKAVSETISGMLNSFNLVLENSLSLKSLRWRWEAWRTDRPFSQVVLLNTLVYQVEQVFLIHQETGLLLGHAEYERAIVKDPDMVSSMLTAIRDFVSDSFDVKKDDQLASMKMGELTILIRQGPHAALATVVRGTPTSKLEKILSEQVETIHRLFGRELAEFNGDSSTFDRAGYLLEKCLLSQTSQDDEVKVPWKPILFFTGIVLAFLAWEARQFIDHNRWQEGISKLNNEPGIEIITSNASYNDYSAQLLIDPFAKSPTEVLGKKFIDKFSPDWSISPYLSLDRDITLLRANKLTNPPETVKTSLKNETLIFSGTASQDWIERINSFAGVIPGISSIDTSEVTSPNKPKRITDRIEKTSNDYLQSISKVESIQFYFKVNTTNIIESQSTSFDTTIDIINSYIRHATENNIKPIISIIGYTDSSGSTEYNTQLSIQRAKYIHTLLTYYGISPDVLTYRGDGVWSEHNSVPSSLSGVMHRQVVLQVTSLSN
jgi:OOP family OmpA-OmpF porin